LKCLLDGEAYGSTYKVQFSNRTNAGGANPVFDKPPGSVWITEVNGAVTNGPARTLKVQLQPAEVQILRR
jgi:hypothetical protein